MSARFHLTPDGAKPCSATQRQCPLGGTHYSTLGEAQAVFEEGQETFQKSSKKSNLPQIETSVLMKPMGSGNYLGANIPNHEVDAYLQAWEDLVGKDAAAAMSATKAARDRGYHYHLTTVGPPEMRKMGGLHQNPFPQMYKVDFEGLGKVEEEGNEAWFIVCSSPELTRWRTERGLPPKDFHITLGFTEKDIHNQSKGSERIIVSAASS